MVQLAVIVNGYYSVLVSHLLLIQCVKKMAKKNEQSLTKRNFSNVIFIRISLVALIFQFEIIEVRGGECGTVDVLDPRISGGSETQRGEWPFIAALYYVEELQFFCGGTVITTLHILTGKLVFV